MLKRIFASTILVILSPFAWAEMPSSTDTESQTNTPPSTFNPNPYPWGIGFGGIFAPNPYIDSGSNQLFIPVISYRGEDFTLYGPYASYNFFKQDRFTTSIQAFLYPETFKNKDTNNPQLRLLNNRNYIVMAGLKQQYDSDYGSIFVAGNVDITGQSNGYMLTLNYAKRLMFFIPTNHFFSATPSIGLDYSSHHLTDYYYGISPSESTLSGLSAYSPSGALSPYIGLSLLYSYKQRWNVMLSTRMNRLPDEITNSPMVGKRLIFTSVATLTYGF